MPINATAAAGGVDVSVVRKNGHVRINAAATAGDFDFTAVRKIRMYL